MLQDVIAPFDEDAMDDRENSVPLDELGCIGDGSLLLGVQ